MLIPVAPAFFHDRSTVHVHFAFPRLHLGLRKGCQRKQLHGVICSCGKDKKIRRTGDLAFLGQGSKAAWTVPRSSFIFTAETATQLGSEQSTTFRMSCPRVRGRAIVQNTRAPLFPNPTNGLYIKPAGTIIGRKPNGKIVWYRWRGVFTGYVFLDRVKTDSL